MSKILCVDCGWLFKVPSKCPKQLKVVRRAWDKGPTAEVELSHSRFNATKSQVNST